MRVQGSFFFDLSLFVQKDLAELHEILLEVLLLEFLGEVVGEDLLDLF